MGLYDSLSKYTSSALLRTALDAARNDVDKREGSILYDALAPLSFVVAQLLQQFKTILHNTEIQTAQGVFLDRVASQYAVTRLPATCSIRMAQASPINAVIEVGAVFKSAGLGLLWHVTADNGDGLYTLTCQTAGANGGRDYGNLDAVNPIDGLNELVFVSTLNEGRDVESDDDFRLRIWQVIQRKFYGGNFADYKTWIFEQFATSSNGSTITGVSFFPPWNGGGMVKIVPFVAGDDGQYTAPDAIVISALKAYLDPMDSEGLGAGVVPVGHRVTVDAPVIEDWNVTANVQLRSGQALTDDLIAEVEADVRELLDNARGDALTHADSDFPTIYSYTFIVTDSLLNRAIQGHLSRFVDVNDIRINGELISENSVMWLQTATNHKMSRLVSLTLSEA